MDRGVSTVLDVGLACLLVTASATLLVTLPDRPDTPPPADRTGRALLASTVTDTTGGHDVETSIADHLAAAVTGGGTGNADPVLSDAVRRGIRNTSARITPRVQVRATATDRDRTLVVGPRPPPGGAVDAAVFRIGTGREPVVVTIRTWSP